MGKGILAGIIWGTISGLLIVVAVSLNAPLPGPRATNVETPTGSEFTRAPESDDLVIPTSETPDIPTVPEVRLELEQLDGAPQTQTPVTDTSTAQVETPVLVVPEPVSGQDETSPSTLGISQDSTEIDVQAPILVPPTENVLDEAIAIADNQADAVIVPQADDNTDVTEVGPIVSTSDPIENEQSVEPAQPGADDAETAVQPTNPEVRTGRLPSISEQPLVPPTPSTPSVFTGALARNALQVELEQGLPLFSIVLIDRSGEGLPRSEIAGLPIPVAVAMDPTVAGASSAAEGYRATGHEVLILAENLPLAGNAADLTVAVTGLLGQIPSAVGVLLPQGSDLGRNRAAMDQVAAILARTGHGLVIVPQGLDSAGQAADAANVPTASIFRVLDEKDEGVPLMTRYMDRAAFEASRDQSVAVLGTIQPRTLEALLSWVDGRRAGTVAVAPISAIMLQ